MPKSFFPVLGLALLIAVLPVLAPGAYGQSDSPDAIAIRVIANPQFKSTKQWYVGQGFKGSPQSLLVDGYEAVRDGRTVYVNAANVDGSSLYANIYVISYNQKAEKSTIDIFGQLLRYWKFNTNLPASGNCLAESARDCRLDADCPRGDFCGGDKARLTRDLRRLSDLSDVAAHLNGLSGVPRLIAGTYLPYRTLSTWPSWQETFGQALGRQLPVDPMNRLGACPSYHADTCWDEKSKTFADASPADGDLDAPAGSHAYIYQAATDGTSYRLCGYLESAYAISLGIFNCN